MSLCICRVLSKIAGWSMLFVALAASVAMLPADDAKSKESAPGKEAAAKPASAAKTAQPPQHARSKSTDYDPFGPPTDAKSHATKRKVAADNPDPFAAPKQPAGAKRAASPHGAGMSAANPAMTGTDRAAHARQVIETALDKPIKLNFEEGTFRDVIEYIKEVHKIPIQFDQKAMEESGFDPDKQITIHLDGVTLRSALNLLLRAENLVYTIRDEVLLITTPDEEGNHLDVELYEVADLVACRDEKDRPWDDYDTLIEMITTQIASTSWDSNGGPGAVTGATLDSAKILVVSQTYGVHYQIKQLLTQIRAIAAKSHGDGRPPMRPRPAPPIKAISILGGSSAAPAADATGKAEQDKLKEKSDATGAAAPPAGGAMGGPGGMMGGSAGGRRVTSGRPK